MTAIELASVTKTFGAVRAVDGVDLTVPAGEVFGLVGPNGAGKTTLLGLACGWLRPSEGRVTVFGECPRRAIGSLKGRIGALPQDAALPPNVPLVQSLTLYARLQGFSRAEARAKALETLETVGLSRWAGAKAITLSHGMAKRAGLAQALLGAPRLVMLDEPTAGLDPKSAHWVRGLVNGLRGKATVVVSSHNLNELETMCDRAAILNHGRVVKSGRMAELTAADSEVVIYLGNPPGALHALARAAGEIDGVAGVNADPSSSTLTVQFSATDEAPEALVTRVLSAVIAGGGLIGSVQRGHGLERQVLAVT